MGERSSNQMHWNCQVRRRGGLWYIQLPQQAVDHLHLEEGDSVKLTIAQDSVTLRRVARHRWTEAELLKGVTPDMCGPELIPDTVGRETL